MAYESWFTRWPGSLGPVSNGMEYFKKKKKKNEGAEVRTSVDR